ncbi:MAG: hypothetical protein WD534_14775 [Phycisphaeraceae bacterium]
MTQFSRYRPLVGKLGSQAAAAAAAAWASQAASPLDARLGLPAARLLLDAAPTPADVSPDSAWRRALAGLAEGHAAADGTDRPLRTPGGQWRDVYHPLVVHLYLRSFARVQPMIAPDDAEACQPLMMQAAAALAESPETGTISFQLWRALCAFEVAQRQALPTVSIESQVDRLVNRDDRAYPVEALHAQDDAEPLDFWTYRELAGLHALGRLAGLAGLASWQARVAEVAAFHLAHTQPDYTTYEPWGLFAFAGSPQTALFAEQQLHDATTHLGQSGPAAGLMVALLLADSFDAMMPRD